jgi:hypothetical protein
VTALVRGQEGPGYFRFRGIEVAHGRLPASPTAPSSPTRVAVAAVRRRPVRVGRDRSQVLLVSTRFSPPAPARRDGAAAAAARLPDAGKSTRRPPAEAEKPGLRATPSSSRRSKLLWATLAPRALESEIFSALLRRRGLLLHTSQQRAMAAATDNADELVRTLTRVMNRARQDSITTEIMEIVGGAEALRQSKKAEKTMTTTHQKTTRAGSLEDGAGRRHRRTGHRRGVPAPRPARDQPRRRGGPSSSRAPITVTAEVAQQIGEGRVRCICMQPTDGLVRGAAGAQPRAGHHGAGGQRRPRSRVQRARRAARHRRHRTRWRTTGRSTAARPPSTSSSPADHVRDGHQGRRPARALRPGWQDRPLRRCRRGQDRPHHGDDPSRRRTARWCLGVRRGGGAHP